MSFLARLDVSIILKAVYVVSVFRWEVSFERGMDVWFEDRKREARAKRCRF